MHRFLERAQHVIASLLSGHIDENRIVLPKCSAPQTIMDFDKTVMRSEANCRKTRVVRSRRDACRPHRPSYGAILSYEGSLRLSPRPLRRFGENSMIYEDFQQLITKALPR